MLIRCPTCASGYELAPDLLTDGRILRCAHCRDAWVHCAAPAASDAPDGPEIVTEARFTRRPGPAPKRQSRRPVRSLAALSFAMLSWRPSAGLAAGAMAATLVVGGMAALGGKARVVAAFPPSEAVFAALGLPVNLSGLSIGEIRSTVVTGDGPATLTLEGHITNLRSDPTSVPPLRIAVRDKSRRELYYWTAPAPKAQLAVGETVLFRSRLTAPPRDGQDLAVSFAEPASGPRRLAEVMPGDR